MTRRENFIWQLAMANGQVAMGVGVRGACEAIVHATRQTLAANPSLWCLQVDFCNAFNLVDREAALAKVEELFPEILKWVNTCYGQPSHLLFGSSFLSSERFFHQGDPLASLLFCLGFKQLVDIIKDRVLDLPLHAWFLDDGTLDQLREVVQKFYRKRVPD